MPYRPVPHVAPNLSEAERRDASRRFNEVMSRRRSIRAFSREPVPWELIENAIRLGTFVVVEDPPVGYQGPDATVPEIENKPLDEILARR